jgi:hypothetical protein
MQIPDTAGTATFLGWQPWHSAIQIDIIGAMLAGGA